MSTTAPLSAPTPDPDLTHALAPCLPGGRLAGPLLAFASIPSTQTVCRGLAAAGAPEGAVVLADHQSRGRGRRGRSWVAPPGRALLVSCLLRPPIEPGRWPELSLMAGCAVAEAVEETTRLETRLKWPNDVLVGGRKVAGVLAEGALGAEPYLILGVGVNVSQRPEEWPAELARRAVSLAALGAPVSREVLLASLLGRLAVRYDDLLARGFDPVRAAWRGRAVLGQRVEHPDGNGVAVDLDPSGALVLRREDGRTATIVVADALDPVTRNGA